jgi:nitrite reductase (NADH) small subunit
LKHREPEGTEKIRRERKKNHLSLFIALFSAFSLCSLGLCGSKEFRMERHVVARAEEIPPGGRKIIRIVGRGEIGVFNVDGAYYALKNTCAHQGSRVCLGKIVGTALPSDVYEYRYGREGEILRCPWHEWEYDIKTGESVFDPKVRVTTYPVEVVDGDVTLLLS